VTLNIENTLVSGTTPNYYDALTINAQGQVTAVASGTAPQAALTLTTTGTSGAATLVGATLNIPQYSGGSGVGGSGTVGTIPVFVTDTTTLGDSRMTQPNSYESVITASGGMMLSLKSSDGNEPNLRFVNSSNQGIYFQQAADGASLYLKPIGSASKLWKVTTGGAVTINDAYTLPTTVTGSNDYVLTAQTDGTTAWAAASASVTFPLLADDGGGASDPSYSFDGDTNTGMFRLTGDTLGFSVGGSAAMYMQSSKVEANKDFEFIAGSAASPSAMFASDNDTGFYSLGANKIGMATGGVARLGIGDAGEILVGGSAAGSSGQVLTSGGAGAAVSWATASASNDFDVQLLGEALDTDGTNYNTFDVLSQAPFGVARYNTGYIGQKQGFFPFIAPKTGSAGALYWNITSPAGSAQILYAAIYDSNGNGVPETPLGWIAIDTTSSGVNTSSSWVDASGSTTVSLTRGTQYFFAFNQSNNESYTYRSISYDYTSRYGTYAGMPSTSNGYGAGLVSNSTVTSAPAAVTADGLEPVVLFSSIGWPCHVGLVI